MKSTFKILFLLFALLCSIELINMFTLLNLNQYGIIPRNIIGLRGILFAPFLHAGARHLLSNLFPLMFLTGTLLVFYRRIWLQVYISCMLLGGGGVWFFARGGTVHIGASGLIFGLAGFIIASGLFRKSFSSLLIALIIFFLYGGLIWGVLPVETYISWESHLFGLIAGIITAWLYRNSPAGV